MENSATITFEESQDKAFKDTQLDEYYENVTPERIQKTLRALKENPYPGLRPFRTSEANVFFGRKDISLDLITRLADHRFLAVLGSSGSGKSSLVRAGLLPSLKTLPGRHGFWKIAICRPGKNPFGNLALALEKAGITPALTTFDIWSLISSSSYGYEELYNSTGTPKEFNTLIVIDQFEELFRYRKDYGTGGKNDAALFVKMLIDVCRNESLNTYVMITMRSEYLGDCVQFPDAVEAINAGQFLVPSLKFKQLRDAIVEPTGFSGASAEPAFAERIIGEIGDNIDQLPLLQHALRRSYERAKTKKTGREGIVLTYTDYTEIGKMENALDNHAKEIFTPLSQSQKKYCKLLFQSITDKATDGRGIRRPLTFSQILKICEESEGAKNTEDQVRKDLIFVIDSYREDNVNFLMPPLHVEITSESEIDISHESIMRVWKDLMKWIEEEAKDADLFRQLLKRDPSEYFKGGKLVAYNEWLPRKMNGINWAALYKPFDLTTDDFAQKFYSGITLIKESNKKQRERQIIKIAGVTGVILTISILALVFYFQNIKLDNQYVILDKQKKELDTLNYTLSSKNNILQSTNEELESNYSKLNTMNRQLQSQKLQLDETNKTLKDQYASIRKYSAELVISNSNLRKTATNLELEKAHNEKLYDSLDLAYGELKETSNRALNLKNLALTIKHAEKSLAIPIFDSARENIKAQLALLSYRLLQVSGEEEKARLQPQIYTALYDAIKSKSRGGPNKPWFIKNYYRQKSDRLVYATFSNDRDKQPLIYLTAEDANLYTFDFQRGEFKILPRSNDSSLAAVDKSSKGRWVVINTLGKELMLMDANKGVFRYTIKFYGTIRTSRFSPDESTLYVYTKDDTLHTINLNDLSTYDHPVNERITEKLEDIAISNTYVYGLTSGGDVIKRDRSNKRFTPVTIYSPNKEKLYRGTRISCMPNDDLLVWGNESGQVYYMEKGSDQAKYLTRFSGPVTDIAYDTDGTYLAIASYNKSIRVFKLLSKIEGGDAINLQAEAPLSLDNNDGSVTTVFFQKKNENGQPKEDLVAVMSPGIIKSYPLDLNTLACELEQLSPGTLSAKELDLYVDKDVDEKQIKGKICR